MNKKNIDDEYLHLGDLELQIMNIIWSKCLPCSVSEIHEMLYPQSRRAYTTIMTVMGNLYKKGVLERRKKGNAYLYTAAIKKNDVAQGAIKKITQGFFKNDIGEFFSCFLKSQTTLKSDEIKELKKKVEQLERERRIKE